MYVPAGIFNADTHTRLLLPIDLADSSTLGLDRMAPLHMVRIRLGLTLDAAVSIDVTSTATLGGDTNLVGAVRISAGLR